MTLADWARSNPAKTGFLLGFVTHMILAWFL